MLLTILVGVVLYLFGLRSDRAVTEPCCNYEFMIAGALETWNKLCKTLIVELLKVLPSGIFIIEQRINKLRNNHRSPWVAAMHRQTISDTVAMQKNDAKVFPIAIHLSPFRPSPTHQETCPEVQLSPAWFLLEPLKGI